MESDLSANHVDGGLEDGEDSQFSFIKGTYQNRSTSSSLTTDSAVAIRNNDSTVAELPGAQYLANRSFSGLER